MNRPIKKPKLLGSGFNSWEKIQSLIEREEIKENLISVQEEMENDFLEAVSFNWGQMSPAEKKLAIRLGCLVQSLRKNLKRAFAKDYQ